MEAIILAGGLGNRLKPVVSDMPKPMAPICGKPFICYLMDYLIKYGISRIILAVGYKREKIIGYFGMQYKGVQLAYSIENEPLGTGGGIKKALGISRSENVFVLNGDTYFDVNLYNLKQIHIENDADLTLSLKPMENYDRYGSVIISSNRVIKFQEKKFNKYGKINGGVYIIKNSLLKNVKYESKFSFEKEFMEKNVETLRIFAFISDGYFIDIGIPEDYEKAKKELPAIYE